MFETDTKFYHIADGTIVPLDLKFVEFELDSDVASIDTGFYKSKNASMTIKFKTSTGFLILEFTNGANPFSIIHREGIAHVIFDRDFAEILGISQKSQIKRK